MSERALHVISAMHIIIHRPEDVQVYDRDRSYGRTDSLVSHNFYLRVISYLSHHAQRISTSTVKADAASLLHSSRRLVASL